MVNSSAAYLKNAPNIICIGRNYADHITELDNVRPKQPFFFLKPSGAVLLPGEGPVVRPHGVDLHYEVELALVIGQQISDLDAGDEKTAMESIAGYALSIDMTARNVQNEAKSKGLPWTIAKGFDTFLPISNIVPRTTIPDPHDVELYLSVNGEIRQHDSTELMLFRIPRILSDISKTMTLKEGDIVLTGTPKGVGRVVPGDILRAGMKVGGQEVDEVKIEVSVAESASSYEYKAT